MLIKRDVQVLVCGAGPVGLASALLLNRRGVRVAVIDEQMRTAARSYACAIHPQTLENLDEAGVAGELVERGQRIDRLAYYQGKERRLEVHYGELPGRFPFLLAVPQPMLEDALERRLRAEGVPVLWSHRLARLDVSGARARVLVEKLEHGDVGYSAQRTAWTVIKEEELEVPFVVGADGHRSLVRRQAGFDFPAVGHAQRFAVWELLFEDLRLAEARVGIGEGGKVSVCWPLGRGWLRLGFEIDGAQPLAGRPEKSRQVAIAGDAEHEHLDRTMLARLLAERMPWLSGEPEEVAWSAAVGFERRLASAFGRGAVWIAGDAAHAGPPVAVQSMNLGLKEAKTLSVELEAVLRTGAPIARLEQWAQARRAEAEAVLVGQPRPEASAQDFAREWARAIGDSLPALGEDRSRLLQQMGLLA